jgi:predicted ATPase
MQAQALTFATELNHANTNIYVRLLAGAVVEQFTIVEGWAVSMTIGPETGLRLLQEGVSTADAQGLTYHIPYYTCLLGQTYARVGDVETGLRLCIDAFERAERAEEHLLDAELHRIHGELRFAKGDPSRDVEDCFRRALERARRQAAKMFLITHDPPP